MTGWPLIWPSAWACSRRERGAFCLVLQWPAGRDGVARARARPLLRGAQGSIEAAGLRHGVVNAIRRCRAAAPSRSRPAMPVQTPCARLPCPALACRRRYPLYITPSMVDTWRSEAQTTGQRASLLGGAGREGGALPSCLQVVRRPLCARVQAGMPTLHSAFLATLRCLPSAAQQAPSPLRPTATSS